MIHEIIPVGPLQCNCSIIGDETTHEGMVIDPGDDIEEILALVRKHSLKIKQIVITHAHIDHVGGAMKLRKLTGAPVLLNQNDYELLKMPALSAEVGGKRCIGVNDISFHRRANARVADLAYALAGEEIGRVRCDGLVVATPQGSTGYNLANGGPVLAWGVEGYVVSFIAPHSLTARALVVAPSDELTINNASREEPVEVHVDGRPTLELSPGEDIHIEFGKSYGTLAQIPGASFYHRLRERFGRLAR